MDDFASSLQEMVSARGKPDLILITGDIAFSGSKEEYQICNHFLKSLFEWLGERAVVIPVPGNHDLTRSHMNDSFIEGILKTFPKKDYNPRYESFNASLWDRKDSSLLSPLFANYLAWMQANILPAWDQAGLRYFCSHFPGDIRVHVTLPGKPSLTVVGLNSAWSHFDDRHSGDLEIFSQQAVCLLEGESGEERKLLLMHHPPQSFSPASLLRFLEEINPPKRFIACLHGHNHKRFATLSYDISGRSFFQAPSLGLKNHDGTTNKFGKGYAWGEMDSDGAVRIWPMIVQNRKNDTDMTFFPDPNSFGDMQNGLLLNPDLSSSPIHTHEEIFYRTWALQRYGTISIHGVVGAELKLDLTRIDMPLHISCRSFQANLDRRKDLFAQNLEEQSKVDRELKDLFLLNLDHHVALFGENGSGKTTALYQLLLHCVSDDGPQSLALPKDTLPIFMRLRRFTYSFLETPLHHYFQTELDIESEYTIPVNIGERLWQRGNLLLLFDGLDEIADPSLQTKVTRYLDNALQTAHKRGIHAVISCRYGGGVQLGDSFLHMDVRPLDQEQIGNFVRLWFRETSSSQSKGSHEQTLQKADKLMHYLEGKGHANQQIKSLVGSPLLLNLLCVVVMQGNEMPRRRVEFYRLCLETLLGRRHLSFEETPPISMVQAMNVLRYMAWDMHVEGRQHDLFEREFVDLVDRYSMDETNGLDVLRWMHVTCGVLKEYSTGCYGFRSLGFQQYLAATYIALHRNIQLPQLVINSGQIWWREVVLLLAGMEERDLFIKLVEAFLPQIDKRKELLRQILVESPVMDLTPFLQGLTDREPAYQVAVLRVLTGQRHEMLNQIARKLKNSPNKEVRLLCHGFIESEIHDSILEPRTNIRLLPVPGDEFMMGSRDGKQNERPRHKVKLSKYWLSETTVTNKQYNIFLKSNQARIPPKWKDKKYSDPDQPVVGISWYEAVNFCEWLSRDSEFQFSLPSEAQWEFAACGTDGRRYPWGNSPPSNSLAHFGQDGTTGRPDKVGQHPDGRGPFGHLDMAGNVWEWCLDGWVENYDQADVTDPVAPQNMFRVRRGGAWDDPPKNLRSTCREKRPATLRSVLMGFRITAIKKNE
ncbi:MAG: SUMF1/EgtB/PvdO family nonheme iron enzyme [Magnetococcales bacterium]|nr:SUMF1/EgtB/PvdO family nonheme iron enzyme [Magnetococcales bacterium]